MKIAPINAALRSGPLTLETAIVHTGQHYDATMKDTFFRQLGIPEPDVDLEVGSGTHAQQTGEIMLRFEPVLDNMRPAAVLVVGDVNSTIACALVAVKKGIPVIHVEAGLRSFDRSMPEEINRVLTDQISELLFTTEPSAKVNLLKEGIDESRIHYVGNVMIDTLKCHLEQAVPTQNTLIRHGADTDRFLEAEEGYGLVTLHRPNNVDEPTVLKGLITTLSEISRRIPLVFPVHPRTQEKIKAAGLEVQGKGALLLTPPLTYLEILGLMSHARLVLTDSGGMQEETTALGVQCLTLRPNTERPITVLEGTNLVVGSDSERIRGAVTEILEKGGKVGRIPELWDGKAAERIKGVIVEWLEGKS
jgi:UDP-N-acetylglucosamine 2-epimerase (non-hydrolysing)